VYVSAFAAADRSWRFYNISNFLAKGVGDENATKSDGGAGEGTQEAFESRSVAAESGDEGKHGS
jgi:hypothetical protein